MSWIIYKHTNLINGKVYIGQTNKTPKERFGPNGRNYSEDYPFGKAIRKYGPQNWETTWKHEIIVKNIPTLEEANELEIYYIKKFNSYIGFPNSNGYNATLGGDNREDLGTPILQIDYNLKVIREWKTITEAINSTGLVTINGCVYHLQISAGGYYWVKKEEYTTDWKPKSRQMGPRRVCQIDIDTLSLVNIFDTIKDAAETIKCSSGHIAACCRKRTNSCFGFYWCYAEDYEHFVSPVTDEKHVYMIDMKSLKILKEFINVASVCEELGGSFTFIDNVCLRKKRCAYGYYFCFKKDYGENWKPVELAKDFRGKSQRKEVRCLETNRIYRSASEAAHDLLINTSCICRCCSNQALSAKGLHFAYEADFKKGGISIKPKRIMHNGTKSVKCLETNETFGSIVEASAKFKINSESISRACKGKIKSAGGYHWEYVGGNTKE